MANVFRQMVRKQLEALGTVMFQGTSSEVLGTMTKAAQTALLELLATLLRDEVGVAVAGLRFKAGAYLVGFWCDAAADTERHGPDLLYVFSGRDGTHFELVNLKD